MEGHNHTTSQAIFRGGPVSFSEGLRRRYYYKGQIGRTVSRRGNFHEENKDRKSQRARGERCTGEVRDIKGGNP